MAATLTPELHQLIADKLVNDISHDDIVAHLSGQQIPVEEAKELLGRVVALRQQALNMPVIGQSNQFKQQAGQVAGTVPFKMTTAPALVPIQVPDPMKGFLKFEKGQIDLGDRQVDVVATVELPRVIIFDNFLSPEECQHLIELALPSLQRSTTVNSENGGSELNPSRTSEGAYFARGQTDTILKIENRLSALSRWPSSRGEGLQVMRYSEGQEYKPHYDYFDPEKPGSAGIIAGPGQRVATFVMYLNTPEQGGSTDFPHAGISVKAKAGRVVFFSYNVASAESKTLHAGAPVISGEKWIATKWLRERDF